jgi:membrane-associated protease RseP (regulator of RpoE activity)
MPESWGFTGKKNIETDIDIEFLKMEVGKYFPFYDIKYNENSAAFFCRIDEDTLEEKFELIRKALSQRDYIPMLRHEGEANVLYIIKKMKRKERPIWINILLIIATIITTILTGSLLSMNYNDLWSVPNPTDIFSLQNLLNGAFLFSLPLMSILLIHEMGHYFISKKHSISTSLPYFLPIPPIFTGFNIGTFGALISSRDPMPNRKALFDVGVAGPIAGFCIALPITAIGIYISDIIPLSEISSNEPILGTSILFYLLEIALLDIPKNYVLSLSPVAFAGWVGLLITSINLLPAGQLDGGHIFRAVMGKKQKYAGWIAVIIMIFTGWWFFALIIIFIMGMMHPPPLNDDTGIDVKRKLLFLVALIILIICFLPFPIYYVD